MSMVRVVRAGLQTTVQDAGRWGWQAMGVPVAGAMDGPAYRTANALIGNAAGSAVLEVAFTGPELVFADGRRVAVTGAVFDLAVNGAAVSGGEPFMVPAGGCLRFGERRSGARAYVAIQGGIDVPQVLGSRSTHVPSKLGGFQGRALVAGDVLPLGRGGRSVGGRSVGSGFSRIAIQSFDAHDIPTLRVLPGRHVGRFAADPIDILQSAPYVVGVASNRMGFRLEGPPLGHDGPADIASEITPMGSLQVPSGGLPILLMADRQTTGGYTVAANVIAADLPRAAQLAPGDRVRFQACSDEDAHAALVTQEAALQALERASRA